MEATQMPLQAQSSLDLKVTKEDLIDIIIDEQLTALENASEINYKAIQVLQKKVDALENKKRESLDKKLRKLLPVKTTEDFKLSYYSGYDKTQITFEFENYTLTLREGECTKLHFTNKETEEIKGWNKEIKELQSIRGEIGNKIHDLNSNNKRVKARMIRTFLTKTNEGKAILKTLGTTPDAALQLTAGK